MMKVGCCPIDNASDDAGDCQDGDEQGDIEHVFLSCLGQVDGWEIVPVNTLPFCPTSEIFIGPLGISPSLPEFSAGVPDGEPEVG